MKQLQLPAPTVLIMMGLPGAGKSFFARQFATSYGLPYISLDKIRFELFNEPTYTPSEQDIISRIAHYMTSEMVRAKHSFVIDGVHTNTKTARVNLQRQAREHGLKTLTVWVQVDEATAKNRSFNRNKQKHDDNFNHNLKEPTFNAWAKQLTSPTGEPYVVISGKHTYAAQHKTVMRKLIQPHSAISNPPAGSQKIITPTPATRPMHTPTRPANRRIQIS